MRERKEEETIGGVIERDGEIFVSKVWKKNKNKQN